MSQMKKSAAVIAAEKLENDKAAELKAAEDAVRRLQKEWAEARQDVRKKQEGDDAALPQCKIVSVSRYSSKDADEGRAVILRKTPTGMLVVRRVGDVDGHEFRFKMNKYSPVYQQAESWSSFSGHRELRDLPPEYAPAVEVEDD